MKDFLKKNLFIVLFGVLIAINMIYLGFNMSSTPPLQPGVQAPAFALEQANGSEGTIVSLASLHGKVVVLDFWSSSCSPCLTGMGILKQLNTRYNSKGVEIVAINVEGAGLKVIREFGYRMGLRFKLLRDPDGEIALAYSVSALPTTFILDKNAKIRFSHSGLKSYETYEREIKQLLNEN